MRFLFAIFCILGKHLVQSACSGTYTLKTSNGGLNYSYDSATNSVVYDVCVNANTYLSIGYGSSMTNTDMVYWGANGASSQVLDLWSTGHSTPSTDNPSAYTSTFTVNSDGSVQFKSTRPLNPGTNKAYVI